MKKNIEKILASAGLIIALVLIIILVVTAFGGIEQSEFDNKLVKGLIITLGVLYLVLGMSTLVMLFAGSDAVREITLRSEQGGSCKATLGVIRKLVKETFYGMEGVKTGKVTLIVRDVFETETYLRTLLEEVFKGALGFKFHAIEFKVVSLQARFKPDKEKVQAEVEEKVAEHSANYAALPNMVEQTAAEGTPSAEAEAAEESVVREDAPAQLDEAESVADAAEEEVEAETEDAAAEDMEEISTEEEAAEEDTDAEEEK